MKFRLQHLKAIEDLLRYNKGTVVNGVLDFLFFLNADCVDISSYSDVDFADLDFRRSTSVIF